MRPALSPYLRSLWNVAPALIDIAPNEAASARPFLSPRGLHLPTQAPARVSANDWFQGAAAHAAAHLVFSQHRFDPTGLRPVTQALIGMLEDARVEWLACRELPGLRRLWLPLHSVQLSDTPTFEGLMQRLAKSLLDPQHHDPHPWVIKGRRLFFIDDDGEMLALRQPQALRHAASLLGNDIGQMRLQFNARLYQVMPSYRDDNSCLWLTDERRADTLHELPSDAAPDRSAQPTEAPLAQRHAYPEWDRQVPMYRPAWCAVLDAPAITGQPSAMPWAAPLPSTQRRVRHLRQLDGDAIDLDALIEAAVAQRSGTLPPQHVYQRTEYAPQRGSATVLLIDASASTAQPLRGTAMSVLSVACSAAWRCAAAMQRAGSTSAIHSFCSDGRHAVHYERVKDFDQPLDAHSLARLNGLRSRLSTRLGAALRHATQWVAQRRGGVRRVLLLTDGKPRDIDVHDARYLIEDARQAVREAARRGVRVQCLSLDATALRPLQRIFGSGQVQALAHPDALPAALGRLGGFSRP